MNTQIKRLSDILIPISNYSFKGRDCDILGITDDSRLVKEGCLFVAIAGIRSDGHDYIAKAIENGAVAVIGTNEPQEKWLDKITYVKVDDARLALGLVASSWNDFPSKALKLIGITGTDGKTTTANIIYHILKTGGLKVGLVSTISAKIGDKDYDTGFHVTNPSALALHKYLKDMKDAGCTHAVIEVTSHGLVQGRVAGIIFDVGVLTNITNEHLDYHKTYEAYTKAKAKLFDASEIAILNKDDISFETMRNLIDDKLKIKTYSRNQAADIYAKNITVGEKTLFTYFMGDKKQTITSNLIGEFNVSNSLAAIYVSLCMGVEDADIAKAFATISNPKGRMQRIENDMGIEVVVDYAHTPNGVESVMKEFTKDTKGKVISIVSAEGERDPGKRFDIPRVSAEYSNLTILNPIDVRSESYLSIVKEMERGAKAGGSKELKDKKLPREGKYYLSYENRGQAIYDAIHAYAQKGDTVLILGKGHETGMDFGDYEADWNDEDAVEMALSGKVFKIKKQ